MCHHGSSIVHLGQGSQNMDITDEQLARFPEAPLTTALEICQLVTSRVSPNTLLRHTDLLLEITLFLFSAQDADLLSHNANRPKVHDGKVTPAEAFNFITNVQKQIEGVLAKEAAIELQRTLEARFAKALDSDFGYEFTDGDIKEAQELIDELRKFLQSTADLSEDHRARLLARLEEVQTELHKKMSTLDRIYCLTIEAGKIGENAKPLIGAAKALFQLAWRTHAHKEGLPSGARPPQLGSDVEPPVLD
jgi:hypothetical protein